MKLYLLILLISYAKCDGNFKSLEEIANDMNVTLNCDDKPCILKCCPLNNYVWKKRCKPYKGVMNSNVTIYKSIENMEKRNDSIFRHFNVLPGMFMANETFRKESINANRLPGINIYLSEKAVMFLEVPNLYKRWDPVENNRFCIDYIIDTETKKLTPKFWVLFPQEERTNPTQELFLTTAMWVSVFFLFLVLLVYLLLAELRNLCGLILMAYVASLLSAFFLLAMIRVKKSSGRYCMNMSYGIYFSFLAAFCWMSVMSYDIWWTFRGYAKARPIHRRGEKFKFTMYSIYAFGVPLAMTIFLATLNETNMSKYPWFITPNVPRTGCFLGGGEKFLYLYTPMLILLLGNWFFYLMTAFNVWRLSRGTAVLDRAAAGTPAAHRSQKNRFLVYLKLSIVMGLNWVLEVVSFLCPDFKMWWITDGYNILIGLAIFIIFVCKPKIFRKLDKRVKHLYKRSQSWQPGNSTKSNISTNSESTSSQETQTLQVCSNPKGPAYTMNNF